MDGDDGEGSVILFVLRRRLRTRPYPRVGTLCVLGEQCGDICSGGAVSPRSILNPGRTYYVFVKVRFRHVLEALVAHPKHRRFLDDCSAGSIR